MPILSAWMLVTAVAVGALVAPARAGEIGIRRVIAEIDFESEVATGQTVPRGWRKSTLPGVELPPEVRFPRYLKGELDINEVHGGAFSFSMTLDGGNLAYTYADGVPAHPDSDYLIVGWVRTDGLDVARAQCRAFLVDGRGQPIPGTTAVSDPMGGPGSPSDGTWRRFEVFLSGHAPAASRLSLTLSLVQPEIWRPADKQAVDEQDIHGRCWWDDIVIYRLPRVSVGTDAPANVFSPGVRPRLKLRLEGLDFAECGVVLTVRTAEGASRSRLILDPPAPGEPVEREMVIDSLTPGLYVADLAISAGGEELMHQYCRFAVLAEVPTIGAGGVELDATRLSPDQWSTLLTLAAPLRIGGVKLPAWPEGATIDGGGPADRRMGVLLDRLHGLGMIVTMVLDRLPLDLPKPGVSASPLVESLAGRDAEFDRALNWLMARRASRVSQWQLGAEGDRAFAWTPQLGQAYRIGRDRIGKMLAVKNFMLAWPSDVEYDLPTRPNLCLRLDSALPADQIPQQLSDFAGQAVAVHLALQDETAERLGRLSDFALRYAFARAAGANRISMVPPWKITAPGQAEPTELLLVARTLSAYLGDADCLGTARLSETSVAVIFRKPGGEGVMFVYRQPDGDGGEALPVSLPETACMVDLWGKRTPIARRRDGVGIIRPASVPTLIAGCDPESLALRGSLRFEPEVVESAYTSHQGRLSFVNPYTQPVSGQLVVSGPEAWKISPRVASFSLGPGEQWTGDLSIRFPYNAKAGLKGLDVTLEVEALEGRKIQAPAFFYLTMKDVTFDPISVITPDGELEVHICIINHRQTPMSFSCFAAVPDRPRLSSGVRDLAPGAKAVKVFRFADGAALAGQSVRTGLREIGGRGVLNHSTVIR